jgi:hypothetical protein
VIPPRYRAYREALAAPHRVLTRVEVWRAGIQVEELAQDRTLVGNSPYTIGARRPVFFTGSVRCTLNSRVTRVLTLTVPEYLYPWKTTDLLAPFGNELRAFRGIEYGDGSRDEFPVFRGPIVTPKPGDGGRLQITANDRAWLVLKAGFDSPAQSNAGGGLVDEVERLILQALPDATFGTHDTFVDKVPVLAYDDDRGEALDNLTKPAGAIWMARADGSFVVKRTPWTEPSGQTPVLLTDGPGGTLFSGYPDRNAESIFNRITVVSERPDGGPAMWATATDTDPASPTYAGGPFGVRSTRVRVTGAASQAQLYDLARSILARAKARVEAWQYTCVPDGSIELGDLISSSYREHDASQYVAGFNMPLDVDGKQQSDGRDLVDAEVVGQ